MKPTQTHRICILGVDIDRTRTFGKVQKFFKRLGDDSKPFDLDAFYDKKKEVLEEVLSRYNRMRKNTFPDMPVIGAFVFPPASMENEHGERVLFHEELMICLYKEILSNDFTPRSFEDMLTMELHLVALLSFYSEVRPEKITLETLLKLDQAMLHICIAATRTTARGPSAYANAKHKLCVSRGKAQQREATRQDILEAYKSTGAYWIDGSKKPITVGEESFSINGFALKQIIIQAGVNLDQKTVVHHLRSLKKDGII